MFRRDYWKETREGIVTFLTGGPILTLGFHGMLETKDLYSLELMEATTTNPLDVVVSFAFLQHILQTAMVLHSRILLYVQTAYALLDYTWNNMVDNVQF